MKKNLLLWCVMLLLPAVAAAFLLYALETYDQIVHNDSGMLVSLLALLCLIIECMIWIKNRRKHRAYTVIAVLSALLLAFVLYIGGKIPFCVECDHVTAEDLGPLTHWISPWEEAR